MVGFSRRACAATGSSAAERLQLVVFVHHLGHDITGVWWLSGRSIDERLPLLLLSLENVAS